MATREEFLNRQPELWKQVIGKKLLEVDTNSLNGAILKFEDNIIIEVDNVGGTGSDVSIYTKE